MKLTINLPDALLENVKRQAKANHRTITGEITIAIEKHIKSTQATNYQHERGGAIQQDEPQFDNRDIWLEGFKAAYSVSGISNPYQIDSASWTEFESGYNSAMFVVYPPDDI